MIPGAPMAWVIADRNRDPWRELTSLYHQDLAARLDRIAVLLPDAPDIEPIRTSLHLLREAAREAAAARRWLAGHPFIAAWARRAQAICEAASASRSAEGEDSQSSGAAGELRSVLGLALGLAVWTGRPLQVETRSGTPFFLPMPGALLDLGGHVAGETRVLQAGRDGIEIADGRGARALFPANKLKERDGRILVAEADGNWHGPVPMLRRFGQNLPGARGVLVLDDAGDLAGMLQNTSHRVDPLDGARRARLVETLDLAFELVRRVDPYLHEELTDQIQVILPIVREHPLAHNSFSDNQYPGVIALCDDPDPLVQAEALVHEMCHNKLEVVRLVDPLLEDPGKEIFYSPWRTDPRPPYGLLVGAHAFLVVALFLDAVRRNEPLDAAKRAELEREVGAQCLKVERALRTLAGHGALTAVGAGLTMTMIRRAALLRESVARFSGRALEKAEQMVSEHRRRHGDGWSVLHRDAAAAARAPIDVALRAPAGVNPSTAHELVISMPTGELDEERLAALRAAVGRALAGISTPVGGQQ